MFSPLTTMARASSIIWPATDPAQAPFGSWRKSATTTARTRLQRSTIKVTPAHGIGGFDLGDWRDQVFAFDYGATGKLDHLVCYRPGTGMIRILKKVATLTARTRSQRSTIKVTPAEGSAAST